jgi:hypothetical protein
MACFKPKNIEKSIKILHQTDFLVFFFVYLTKKHQL